MAGLNLRNVSKRYDEHEVMRDINLDIQDGEFVVFVGPSGCGKSTLMRMIAGLEEISGGDLKIDGVRVNAQRNLVSDVSGNWNCKRIICVINIAVRREN